MGSSCESVPTANSSSASTVVMNSIPPFLSKTYDMVDDQSTNEVVSWSSGNNSFVVWNVPEFAKQFLPKYFKHNNFSSFVRQLNTYVSHRSIVLIFSDFIFSIWGNHDLCASFSLFFRLNQLC